MAIFLWSEVHTSTVWLDKEVGRENKWCKYRTELKRDHCDCDHHITSNGMESHATEKV